MKIIVRIMILSFIIVGFLYTNVTLGQLTIREDELNIIASEAISTTQVSAREQIEDKLYGTNNARCKADDSCYKSNDDYLDDLKRNLKALITTKSIYEIDVYGVDYEKGLLDVEIKCKYTQTNGKIKTLSVRKTSIIDVVGTLKYAD